MAKRYRVVHQRRSIWEALISGRGTRDCYLAQAGYWWDWRTVATFPTLAEAETACSAHAGGTLLRGGDRIVSEFERPE
ncbi:hypothetical protein FHS31_001879 [Sphingomonas vulcanisoli]|uniref:DUF1330 domain-containing protein n=1 Tax=Sphingomonas vulcanisoli TaxID=1658060 RepID=A0ABX0TV50_9SPHN|nr:hypothetical protein [Sphingomonas vulcanisoli]NIJ08262.1 hypothetical protein [Sphingomonas vulcanisoli]